MVAYQGRNRQSQPFRLSGDELVDGGRQNDWSLGHLDKCLNGGPESLVVLKHNVDLNTNASGVIATSHIVASHNTKLLLSFRQILQFRFRENPQGKKYPPGKAAKTKSFLCTCYTDPSVAETPLCCEAGTNKIKFSATAFLIEGIAGTAPGP